MRHSLMNEGSEKKHVCDDGKEKKKKISRKKQRKQIRPHPVNAVERIGAHLFDELVDTPDELCISLLPVMVVVPSFLCEADRQGIRSSICFLMLEPASSSWIESVRLNRICKNLYSMD